MTRLNTMLAAAAAIQFALVGITWWPSAPTAHPERDLVALPGEVDRVEITGRLQPGQDGPDTALELARVDGSWVIPTAHDYPADPDKVQELLGKLTSISVRAPLSVQPTSHASLNVADGDHGRSVTLHSGEASVSLILGSASGTSAHLRRADEAPVYTVRGFTAFSIGDQARQYWEADLVSIDVSEVDSLTVSRPDGGFTLERGPTGWTEAGDEAALDSMEIDGLLKRLDSVKISDVAGTETPAELAEGTRVEWTADGPAGTVRGAVTFGPDQGGKMAARVDGSRWTVHTPTGSVQRWHTVTVEELADTDDLAEMPPHHFGD